MRNRSSDSLASNPWERLDRYGECGLKPQPLWEKLRILLVFIFIVPIKILGSLGCLVSFYLVTKLSFVFPPAVRSDWVATLGKLHCRMCLLFIGFIKVTWIDLSGQEGKTSHDKSRVGGGKKNDYVGIVSNHCSWCDILVHMSHFFPAFVARSKTEHTRFVGPIRYVACILIHYNDPILYVMSDRPSLVAGNAVVKPWAVCMSNERKQVTQSCLHEVAKGYLIS